MPALRPSKVSASDAACDSFEINELADKHRASNVWHNKLRPASAFRHRQHVALMANHAEHGGACQGFVEHAIRTIDEALWLRPFPVKSRFKKFAVGHDVLGRDRLTDVAKNCAIVVGSNFMYLLK